MHFMMNNKNLSDIYFPFFLILFLMCSIATLSICEYHVGFCTTDGNVISSSANTGFSYIVNMWLVPKLTLP